MAIIPGLPKQLRVVPENPEDWREWRNRVLAYRILTRNRANTDVDFRRDVVAMAIDDPCYDFCVFGSVFEPRARENQPPGWLPMIPYHFQVDLVRWIEEILSVLPGTSSAKLGRGDGVMEKARGMAGSWTCAAYAATQWKYSDGFIGGFMSYKQDLVDKANNPESIFVKIDGYLGLDRRVPELRMLPVGEFGSLAVPIRSPEWMIPEGYDAQRHNHDLILAHPTKTNILSGYSTGPRTGVGSRQTVMFLDEAAKFDAFRVVWDSMSAVTDHRIALSSADTSFGTAFRDLARHAERSLRQNAPGPAFLRLKADIHPDRDEIWREEMSARHADSGMGQAAMAREYDLDYEAGNGALIYRKAQEIEPVALDFNPSSEIIDFCIDPGMRDMNAFHLVKYTPATGRYGLMASYANNGYPAEFYASLCMGELLVNQYSYGPEEERIADIFARYLPFIRLWVGDPAGKHRGPNATSFYDEFRMATDRISDGKKVINIWNSNMAKFSHIDPRIAALRWLLDRMDINNTPDVRTTLEAIRDHRFSTFKEGRENTVVGKNPVHSWGHDRVTALEFYAANRKNYVAMDDILAEQRKNGVIRRSMSGKPMNRRHAGYVRG